VLHERSAGGFVVRLPELERGLEVLQRAGMDASLADGSISVKLAADRAGSITKLLADQGLYLSELRPLEADLETVFLELTRDPAAQDGIALAETHGGTSQDAPPPNPAADTAP
jgi:ABC-2 type transport system ATP-binding protein